MLVSQSRRLKSRRSGGWSPERKRDFVFRRAPARVRAPWTVSASILIATVMALAPDTLATQVRLGSPPALHVLETGWRLIDEVRALHVERMRAAASQEHGLPIPSPSPPGATVAIAAAPEEKRAAAVAPPMTAQGPPAQPETKPLPQPPEATRTAAVIRDAPMRLTPVGTAPVVDGDSLASECLKDVAALARGTMLWFEANSIALNPVQARQIQKLAEAAAKCPASRIEAIGHADQIGSEAANLSISRRRAESALQGLQAWGLDATRISAVGLGARQPIAMPGNSPFPDPNAINRRVEFVVR